MTREVVTLGVAGWQDRGGRMGNVVPHGAPEDRVS